MRHNLVNRILLGFLVGCFGLVGQLQAGLIVTEVSMVAEQKINFSLFGVQDTLVASGLVKWTFDVDPSNNTVPGGASSVDALFTGVLPGSFGGLAGATFELFSEPLTSIVTATNNGTHVKALTNFGLRVYGAPNFVIANFYTTTPSLFESDVISLTNFTGSVFQDPARPSDSTNVFIGANILPGGIPEGTLVGESFDRTVTAVPEPSSLMICSVLGLAFSCYRIRRKHAS